jgi:hypothetical protein
MQDMRLSTMSGAFNTSGPNLMPIRDYHLKTSLALVDKERDKQKSTKLQKLIRSAEFRDPNYAWKPLSIIRIKIWTRSRRLNSPSCYYISDDHHIILKD